jgi:hypothetical protein
MGLLAGCSTHRESGCCASASVAGAAPVDPQPARVGWGSREASVASGAPRRKGETVTDATQESRVLGVEAVVGGDAELRR